MLVLESQYVIPFFANLILKSVGKLLSFSKIVEKGYYSPVNQGWQDVGRVFRDWSFPFVMSTPPPLGFSDHLLTFLEPSQGLAARDTTPHEPAQSSPHPLHQISETGAPSETSLLLWRTCHLGEIRYFRDE